jgi:dTDP-glucose 4,6-dehydratase
MATILVTGGAGFIGANYVHQRVRAGSDRIVVLDALTYAGNLESLRALESEERFAS